MASIVGESRRLGRPAWAKDFGGREHIVPFPAKLDPTQFNDGMAVLAKANGVSAIAATAVTVDALLGAIPAGTVLWFGGVKYARLTADAAIGATSLAVAALVAATADNDEARYAPTPGTKYIPSGMLLGRTFAEAAANTPFGLATDTDDEIYFNVFELPDAIRENDCELYRHGSAVATNHLPQETQDLLTANANLLAKVRAQYVCLIAEA